MPPPGGQLTPAAIAGAMALLESIGPTEKVEGEAPSNVSAPTALPEKPDTNPAPKKKAKSAPKKKQADPAADELEQLAELATAFSWENLKMCAVPLTSLTRKQKKCLRACAAHDLPLPCLTPLTRSNKPVIVSQNLRERYRRCWSQWTAPTKVHFHKPPLSVCGPTKPFDDAANKTLYIKYWSQWRTNQPTTTVLVASGDTPANAHVPEQSSASGGTALQRKAMFCLKGPVSLSIP